MRYTPIHTIEKQAISLLNEKPELLEKAFPTYFGGKEAEGAFQHIINQIPECDLFIEAMGGNYAVSRYLTENVKKWVNDIDPEAYDKYEKTVHYHLPNYMFSNVSYKAIIELLLNEEKDEEVVIYFDPPYRLSSRKSSRKVYNFEWTNEDHKTFLRSVKKLVRLKKNVRAIISHYPDFVYEKALDNWQRRSFRFRQGKAKPLNISGHLFLLLRSLPITGI